MAAKTTKKSGSGATKATKSKAPTKATKSKAPANATKSKAPTKGGKVTKISAVKKAPARKQVAKTGSVKAPAAKPVPSKSAKAETTKKRPSSPRKGALKKILLAKRLSLIQQMQAQLGQSLTDEQQRRLEAAMDSGDQALVDLDREMGISLQEMRLI